MNNKLVSISILFVLILLLLAKHLKYHYFLILFLSILLIYLIHFKLITYLYNETFYEGTCDRDTEIRIGDTSLDADILETIMDKLSKFN